LKVTRCSAEHRTTSLSSWVPLSFSECIRSWQRRRPEGRRRLQPIRFLGAASTLLTEPRRLPRSRRSLGTARPKAGSADHCLDSLKPHQPLTSIRHGSVVVRCLPRSSRHSRLTPHPHPKALLLGSVEGMPSRTPRTVEDTFSLAHPKAHEGPVPRRPSSFSISHCALASSSRSPLSRRLLSYDPVVRFRGAFGASGSGLPALDHARPHRGQLGGGARQARSHRLATSRTRRSRGSRLGHPFAMGTADGSDPGRHRPMSATHDSVFKTGNPSSRHTPLGVPTPRGGSRFTASEPASAFAAAVTGALSSPAAFPRVPRMLRHPRDPRQNATCRVHQRRPRPSRAKARSSSGQPPDGLDLRHRVA